MLMLKKVDRPRELKWFQAGAMLYGDWGTSKAYVIGIAFALAGHASWFYLGLMAILTMLVGFSYMIICPLYPDGGGVYSALRNRSRLLAMIGGLMLIAGYVVTASLSALSAFQYFGVSHPAMWAIGSIAVVGIINWIGPSKVSNIAAVVAVTASILAGVLFLGTLPHLSDVTLVWPQGKFMENWGVFAGIVLAISGAEAVANMTGVMVEPVRKTAKWAIVPVMLEVSVLTFLLGIAMNGVPNLHDHVEDMLRVLGAYYVAPWFGEAISIVFALLLISAVNTAVNSFTSIQFAFAKDRELPQFFTKLNRFGVPWLSLLVATAVPMLVLFFVQDLLQLAALYAIGVVGAIAFNLGACTFNRELPLKFWQRFLLGGTCLVLVLIEITIAVQKPQALVFALIVVGTGLLLRRFVKTFMPIPIPSVMVPSSEVLTVFEAKDIGPLYKSTFMLALKRLTPSMIANAARQIKLHHENAIYLCYVEEIPSAADLPDEITPSAKALEILAEVEHALAEHGVTAIPVWQVGHQAGKMLAHAANELGAKTVFVGMTEYAPLVNMLRGDVIRQLTRNLKKDSSVMVLNS
jgi:amino acid transporter